MLFFRKFPVAVKFMDKKRGGGGRVSRFSIESFFYLTLPKTCRGTIQCVTDFGYRKILCLRGLCHDFSFEFFCLAVPKNFAGEPL